MAREVGGIGKAAALADLGDALAGVVQQPEAVTQTQVPGELERTDAKRIAKPPLQVTARGAHPLGQRLHRQRLPQVLLEHRNGAANQAILDLAEHHRLRLRVGTGSRLVEEHDIQALHGPGLALVTLDQIGRQVGRRRTAGTGEPVSVIDEQSVGHRLDGRKALDQIAVVIPADAAAPPLHEASLDQREHPGTQPHQRNAGTGRLTQVGQGSTILPVALRLNAPHDHDIVELSRVAERLTGRNGRTAAGEHRLAVAGHEGPATAQLPASIALVGGQAKAVDEGGEGHQGEPVQQDKADGEGNTLRCGVESHA